MIHYSIENCKEAHDPAIPFLDIYPREFETRSNKKLYNIFIAALLTIAQKSGNNPNGHQLMKR